VEQEAASPFTGISKAVYKRFSFLGGGMSRFLLLWQTPLLALCKKSVLVPCENNDQVLPKIISQEIFLAKEKCSSEPMFRQKKSEIHMANPKCLLFDEPDHSKQW